MPSKGTMIYVTPSGISRMQTVKVTDEHPNFLRNFSDDQSHPQEERPTFAVTKPVPAHTIEEMMALDPVPLRPTTKWMAVCEDQADWPYSCNFITQPEEWQRRQRKRQDYRQEGIQYAQANAVKRDLNQGPLKLMAIVSVIVFSCFMLLIALVLANYKFNQPAPPVEVALLLGAVGVAIRRKNNTSPVAAPVVHPTGRKLRCFIFGCNDKKVRHKIVPLSLLQDHFSDFYIHQFDITRQKAVYTGLLTTIVTTLAFGLLYELAPPLIYVLTPLVMFCTAGIGWASAHWAVVRVYPLMTPFTCFYMIAPENIDSDTGEIVKGEASLIPIRHTLGRGVDPMVYDVLKEEMMRQEKVMWESLGIEGQPQYRPTVNRADSLHQDLDGKIERAKYQMPDLFNPKLEIGALMVMALASVGIFFFVVFATTGG